MECQRNQHLQEKVLHFVSLHPSVLHPETSIAEGGTFAVFVVGTFLGFAVDVDLFAAAVVSFTVHGSTGSTAFTETSAVCFICMRAPSPVISISPLEQSSFSLYIHLVAEHLRIVIVRSSMIDFFNGNVCPYSSIRKKNKNIQKNFLTFSGRNSILLKYVKKTKQSFTLTSAQRDCVSGLYAEIDSRIFLDSGYCMEIVAHASLGIIECGFCPCSLFFEG